MRKIYHFVLLPSLILGIELSEKQHHFKDLIDTTIIILDTCLPENAEQTLLLAGDYNKFLRRGLFRITPVALIAESQFNALEQFTLTKHSYINFRNDSFVQFFIKLWRFVIIASSQPLLRSLLQRTKDSPWANSNGFYILIDTDTEIRGCMNAYSYLWTAWEYDLLSAVFLCIDPDDGIIYYTYNPYSNDTPNSWHEVGRVKGRNGHPWVMFKRKKKNLPGPEICTDLDFEKTTNLNGYPIRLNAIEMEPFLTIKIIDKNVAEFNGDCSKVLSAIFEKLNATMTVLIHNGSIDELGSIGLSGTMEGMLTAVSNGRVDMGMNMRFLLVLWKLRYTYPYTKSGICAITQSAEEKSEITKLITFMTPQVMLGVSVICLIAYVIFAKSEGYVRAGLEVIRLMVCVSMLHPPKICSTRIFTLMVFILFLNINILFQSHWSSLLTVPAYYNKANKLEDLKRLKYQLYGPSIFRDNIGDPYLESQYKEASYDECKRRVEISPTNACIGDCYHIRHRIIGNNLHKSKNLHEMLQTFVTREDWPLFEQVENSIRRLAESGLMDMFRRDSLEHIRRYYRTMKAKKGGYKVLVLGRLAFSFYFLGIGYACATIVFVIELIIGEPSLKDKPKVMNRKNEKSFRRTRSKIRRILN